MHFGRNTAEFVSRYFTKGRMAVVEGRLQMRDWTDKDGNKRRSAEVVADQVYFGDAGKKDDAPTTFGGMSYPNNDDFQELPDDDGKLPFWWEERLLKESFVVRTEWAEQIDLLTDEQAGQLLKAWFKYHMDESP